VAGVNLESFIETWIKSQAAERANYALFLTQLCDLMDVPQPDPTTSEIEQNSYVFERDVLFLDADGSTSTGRIDLYKRCCFVLEAKQGSDAQHAAEREEAKLNAPVKRKPGLP
jgi:hypothetical protein